MKVYDNIELFHRKRGQCGPAVVSDEEFRQGLSEIINAVLPYRKDPKKCVDTYYKKRDALPLTASIADKESLFSRDFAIGQKSVDLAVLEVIYEDRYSFGHLYWALIQRYENEPVEIDRFVDPEAPFKKGLIEYATEYDLTKTVEEYENCSSLDDRFEYILGCLRRSQGEVLVKHRIKEDYEVAVSRLVEECRAELKDLDLAILEADSRANPELPAVSEPERVSSQREFVDTPFAINYVIESRNRERLMAFLHARIADKDKQFALIPIQAAINAGLLTMPSSTDFNEEFGKSIADATYYDRIKDSGVGGFKQKQRKVLDMTKELEEMFK